MPIRTPFTLCATLLALATWAGAPAQAAVSVEVVEQGPRATVLRLRVGAPELLTVDTPAGAFQRFSQRSATSLRSGNGLRGQPELPVAGFTLALPVGLQTAPIVQVQPEGRLNSLKTRLYPVQPGENANADLRALPPFSHDPALYEKGGAGRGGVVDRLPIFKGDANLENLRFTPYGYEPANGELSWHDSYLITVQHAGRDCFLVDHLSDTRTANAFDAVDRMIERDQPLPALRHAINQLQFSRQCPPFELAPVLAGNRFIIVSPPALLAAAESLATHKRQLGISTEVVSTQAIAGTGAPLATAVQIRSWLAQAYNNRAVKPKWVLLLGDAELIPTHYDDPNWWSNARNAGDIWYGQIGPGAGPTTVPVFGLGRIPVDTLAQALTVVNKVIAFENHPPPDAPVAQDFYSRMAFAAYFESFGTTDTRWFVETTERIRDHAVNQGFHVQRMYIAPGQSNPTTYRSGAPVPPALRKPGFAWNATRTDIVNAINQGSALVYHRDHGNWYGWGDPYFRTENLGEVSVVGNRFPVIFSINCASGVFDNETVDLPANTLGGYGTSVTSVYWAEAFLRKTDGALAIIGDTRDSSTRDNSHLAIGLFDALFPGLAPGFGSTQPVRRLGDLLNHGRAFIAAVDAGTTANLHPTDNGVPVPVENLRNQLNIYNLLGDPTLKLRTKPPGSFTVVSLNRLRGVLQVQATLRPCSVCDQTAKAPPVPVVVTDPLTGRVLGRGLLDAGGRASIDIGAFDGRVVVRLSDSDGGVAQASPEETDTDGDGVPDSRDNCTAVANANQKDSDSDGYGDACDADTNNDGIVNSLDVAAVRGSFGIRGVNRADLNGDGIVNALDVALVRRLFATRPGPSAWGR